MYISPKETFPSKEFSEHTGIKDLYTDWVLPDGMSPEDVADVCGKYCESAEFLHHQIVTLNTKLADIKIVTYRAAVDLIMGAVSKFIFDDIAFFVGRTDERNALILYNMGNDKRKDKIVQICGKYPEWVCCPKTLERIEKELGIIKLKEKLTCDPQPKKRSNVRSKKSKADRQ